MKRNPLIPGFGVAIAISCVLWILIIDLLVRLK